MAPAERCWSRRTVTGPLPSSMAAKLIVGLGPQFPPQYRSRQCQKRIRSLQLQHQAGMLYDMQRLETSLLGEAGTTNYQALLCDIRTTVSSPIEYFSSLAIGTFLKYPHHRAGIRSQILLQRLPRNQNLSQAIVPPTSCCPHDRPSGLRILNY